MIEYIVKAEEKGKRLDAYVASKNEDITRTAAQRLIEEEKKCLLNIMVTTICI